MYHTRMYQFVLGYVFIYVFMYHFINLYILLIMGISRSAMRSYKSFSSNNKCGIKKDYFSMVLLSNLCVSMYHLNV